MMGRFNILSFLKYSKDVVGMWIVPLALATDMTRPLNFNPLRRASMIRLDCRVFLWTIFHRLIVAKGINGMKRIVVVGVGKKGVWLL